MQTTKSPQQLKEISKNQTQNDTSSIEIPEIALPVQEQEHQSVEQTQSLYHDIDLGHKVVRVRKWKGKDRKNFKKALKEDNVETAIMDALVMSCLEDKNIPLSPYELQYLFIKMRELSISPKFKFEYKCKCENLCKHELKIDDVISFTYSPWKKIKNIEFQEVPNAKVYNADKEIDELKELAYRTKTIDGNIMSFDDVLEYYEDMDIDELDEILEEFDKMTFMVHNEKEFTCPECSTKKTFEFDEIPGFFPETWTKF